MNLLESPGKNNFLIFLASEEKYIPKIIEIIKSARPDLKLCYICFSTTYDDILSEFESKGIKKERVFFIDTLSSHYHKLRKTKTCAFVSSPTHLDEIEKNIKKAVSGKGCKVIIFDTISKLLTYSKGDLIVRFTHKIITHRSKKTKTIFILLKGDNIPDQENKELIKDLAMFADKVIDLDASLIL